MLSRENFDVKRAHRPPADAVAGRHGKLRIIWNFKRERRELLPTTYCDDTEAVLAIFVCTLLSKTTLYAANYVALLGRDNETNMIIRIRQIAQNTG